LNKKAIRPQVSLKLMNNKNEVYKDKDLARAMGVLIKP